MAKKKNYQGGFIQIPVLIIVIAVVGSLATASYFSQHDTKPKENLTKTHGGELAQTRNENDEEVEQLKEKIIKLEKINSEKPVTKSQDAASSAPPPQPIPTAVIIPTEVVTENPILKIAKCEAKRNVDYSNFVIEVDQTIKNVSQEIETITQKKIQEYEQDYNTCVSNAGLAEYNTKIEELNNLYSKLDTLEEEISARTRQFGVSEAERRRILAAESGKIWNKINPLLRSIDIFDGMLEQCAYTRDTIVQLESDYSKKLISDTKSKREGVLVEYKQQIDTEYKECVDNL